MGLRLTSLSVPSQDWVWLTPVDTEQESFADVSSLVPRLSLFFFQLYTCLKVCRVELPNTK